MRVSGKRTHLSSLGVGVKHKFPIYERVSEVSSWIFMVGEAEAVDFAVGVMSVDLLFAKYVEFQSPLART
jgi:hypothetical protein